MADLFGSYEVETPRASDPVSLADAKSFMGISGTGDDALITSLITTATDLCEQYTKRTTVNTTFKAYFNSFGAGSHIYNGRFSLSVSAPVNLRRSKLQSITSVEYYTGDVLTVLDPSKYYKDNRNDFSSVYPVSGSVWPSIDTRADSVQITFVAGYGASDTDVPQPLRNAIMTHVSWLYEQRGQSEDCAGQVPMNVRNAYNMYRIQDIRI